jgi:hypothetical protein
LLGAGVVEKIELKVVEALLFNFLEVTMRRWFVKISN